MQWKYEKIDVFEKIWLLSETTVIVILINENLLLLSSKYNEMFLGNEIPFILSRQESRTLCLDSTGHRYLFGGHRCGPRSLYHPIQCASIQLRRNRMFSEQRISSLLGNQQHGEFSYEDFPHLIFSISDSQHSCFNCDNLGGSWIKFVQKTTSNGWTTATKSIESGPKWFSNSRRSLVYFLLHNFFY